MPTIDHITRQTLLRIRRQEDHRETDLAVVAKKKKMFNDWGLDFLCSAIFRGPYLNWLWDGPPRFLIHWDSSAVKTIDGVSYLSVMCLDVLKAWKNYNTLVFFCGRHVDPLEHSGVGAHAMVTSLIVQLLKKMEYRIEFLPELPPDIDIAGAENGELEALIKLLFYLIRELGRCNHIHILIDGATFFEQEAFKSDALPVFQQLIRVTKENTTTRYVQVLFTNTSKSTFIRDLFDEKENEILAVAKRSGAWLDVLECDSVESHSD